MVVACIALLFAMTGAGYAAGMLGPNTVGTKQLKKNAVISSKVKNGSLLGADFKAGQLPQGPQGPQGAQGPQGIQGPGGPAGIARIDTVRSARFPIAAIAYSGLHTAAFPAGEFATGGGTYGALIGDRVVVTIPWNLASGLTGRADSWGGGVVAGASASSMTVMVLCSPAAQGTGSAGEGPSRPLPETLR